eukprot:GHVU01215067.1.p1 GENE.GHVU01215067.1~~GHVU01215067.1.p1  ORF type:complete len:161 (+),score=20.01 GHVU01215067.1:24-506(+)
MSVENTSSNRNGVMRLYDTIAAAMKYILLFIWRIISRVLFLRGAGSPKLRVDEADDSNEVMNSTRDAASSAQAEGAAIQGDTARDIAIDEDQGDTDSDKTEEEVVNRHNVLDYTEDIVQDDAEICSPYAFVRDFRKDASVRFCGRYSCVEFRECMPSCSK